MSGRSRKIVRRALISAGLLVGLIILIIAGAVVASWSLSRDDYAYDWDHSVENTSGRAGNHSLRRVHPAPRARGRFARRRDVVHRHRTGWHVSTAARPWEWGMFFFFERVSKEAQVNCYQAMFDTFWDKPWFGGLYVWTWYPYAEPTSGYLGRGFTPMGKPAENVMARWFGKPPDVGAE